MTRALHVLALAFPLAAFLGSVFGLFVHCCDTCGPVMWLLLPGLAWMIHQEMHQLPGPATTLMASGALLVLALVTPNFVRCHPHHGQLGSCKSNLKNIGTALEIYSTDYAGRYPRRLEQLTPNYLKTIPTCPSAGEVTYVARTASEPDLYTVVCRGLNHPGQGIQLAHYPQYTSITGLIERP